MQIAIGPVRESCHSPLCPLRQPSWQPLLARPQHRIPLHNPRRHSGRCPNSERLLVLDGGETRQQHAVVSVALGWRWKSRFWACHGADQYSSCIMCDLHRVAYDAATPHTSQAADGSQAYRHAVPCGLHLEVLHQQPAAGTARRHSSASATHASPPPLLFLHGAMHGAWCWQVGISSFTSPFAGTVLARRRLRIALAIQVFRLQHSCARCA